MDQHQEQRQVDVSPRPFVALEATPSADRTTTTTKRKRWLVALVAVCAVACVTVGAVVLAQHKNDNKAASVLSALQQTPALQVTLTFKRESMMYFGQPTSSVYILPRGTSPDGKLQFDGVLELTHDNTIEKYVYLNNRAYYTKAEDGKVVDAACLRRDQLPPFELVDSALTQAKVVDQAVVGDSVLTSTQDCPQGRLLHLKFAGESFVFCSSGSNQLVRASGNDMDMAITYLSDLSIVPDVSVPAGADGAALQCDPVMLTTGTEDLALNEDASLSSTMSDIAETLMGQREAQLMGASCGCKSAKKPCLFVHGVGNPFASPMTDTFPLYWGQVHKHMPCCSSIKFVHFNTLNLGWNNPTIQQDFCSAALQVSGSKDKTIGKIILVTHSMGNMIAGASVASGKCSMSKDVTWISSAGPMKGSKSANLLARKCTDGGWNDLIKKPLEFIGFCPPTPAFASLVYQTTADQATQAQLIASQKVRQQYVTKTLCGTDAWGLNTIFSLPFKVVGEWSQHGDKNDGMVSVESCVEGIGMAGFGGEISSRNYLGRLNHVDLTFREGDGWWGSDRKPVKWLECAL